MSEVRGLFDYQQQATEAKRSRHIPSHLRLAEESVPVEVAPSWTRQATRLELFGWDHKVRMGRRIWSHAEITGGFWVSEEIAVHRNSERKG